MAGNANGLESIFECPVCQYVPYAGNQCGNIYQCHNGHLICQECYERLPDPARCPTCREPMAAPPIRNRAVEQVQQFQRPYNRLHVV